MATGFVPPRDDVKREILRCGKDPEYFIYNYVKTDHPTKGVLPFKLYPFQKETLQNFINFRFNVVLKARQLGISTLAAAYIVWLIMFHRDKSVMVVATKFSVAGKLVRKVRKMIQRLPQWICMSKVITNNRQSIELDNGSILTASTTASDTGRSESLSLLVVDEAAHVEGMDELWTALFPTLSTGGACILLSSPNGVGNFFHRVYVDSKIGKNDFKYIDLPWYVHPERDKGWFEKETKNMTRQQIAQELMCDFLMSGDTVFDPNILAQIEKAVVEPIRKAGYDQNLWIWKDSKPGVRYFLSADVARGDGSDFSAFHVFDLVTTEIVAEYKGKLTVDFFSSLIYNTGIEYNSCMVVIENNSIGWAVLKDLQRMRYPNLYYTKKSSGEFMEQYEAELSSNSVLGFTTSTKSRPIIIAKFEEFLRNNQVKIHSTRLAAELRTFIWKNGKPEAMSGYNDDLVLAGAIGCWVKETVFFASSRDEDYIRAMLSGFGVSNTKLNTRIEGMTGAPRRKIGGPVW